MESTRTRASTAEGAQCHKGTAKGLMSEIWAPQTPLWFSPFQTDPETCSFSLGSIQQLHDRVTQLCAEYRALYEQLNIPDVGPRVDWAKILDQKMVTAAGFRCISQILQGQIMSAVACRALRAIVCSAACWDVWGGGSNSTALGRRMILFPPLKTLWSTFLIDSFILRAAGGRAGRGALMWDERIEKVMSSGTLQPCILGFHAAVSVWN